MRWGMCCSCPTDVLWRFRVAQLRLALRCQVVVVTGESQPCASLRRWGYGRCSAASCLCRGDSVSSRMVPTMLTLMSMAFLCLVIRLSSYWSGVRGPCWYFTTIVAVMAERCFLSRVAACRRCFAVLPFAPCFLWRATTPDLSGSGFPPSCVISLAIHLSACQAFLPCRFVPVASFSLQSRHVNRVNPLFVRCLP